MNISTLLSEYPKLVWGGATLIRIQHYIKLYITDLNFKIPDNYIITLAYFSNQLDFNHEVTGNFSTIGFWQEIKSKNKVPAANSDPRKFAHGVICRLSKFHKIPAFCSISTSTHSYGYGSIPINTIFSGMNIHLPAILMFTRRYKVLTHCHIQQQDSERSRLHD